MGEEPQGKTRHTLNAECSSKATASTVSAAQVLSRVIKITGSRLPTERCKYPAPNSFAPEVKMHPTTFRPRHDQLRRHQSKPGSSRHNPLAIEHIVANAASGSHDLCDIVFRHAKLLQRRLQMTRDSIEMGIVQPLFDQRRMRGPHILSGVIVWFAERHRQKGFLLRALFIHIGRIKEMADGIVR
jgi:hypothetical protein